ncbi:hypothetical protein MTO96_038143, partial [Rhipicephalus appendiculatus]
RIDKSDVYNAGNNVVFIYTCN